MENINFLIELDEALCEQYKALLKTCKVLSKIRRQGGFATMYGDINGVANKISTMCPKDLVLDSGFNVAGLKGAATVLGVSTSTVKRQKGGKMKLNIHFIKKSNKRLFFSKKALLELKDREGRD